MSAAAVLNLLKQGGPITWIIFVLGAVSAYIIVERALHLHRAQINVPEFLRGITNVVSRGNVVEAISICEDTPGPVSQVVRVSLIHCREGRESMIRAIQEASLAEIPRLESNLRILLAIAHLAPLLGLLGTVVGMIGLFHRMDSSGGMFFSVSGMAGPIWMALLNTASGLTVAIPAYGFYCFYHARLESLLLDMEKGAAEIVYFLSVTQVKFAGTNGAEAAAVTPPVTPENGQALAAADTPSPASEPTPAPAVAESSPPASDAAPGAAPAPAAAERVPEAGVAGRGN